MKDRQQINIGRIALTVFGISLLMVTFGIKNAHATYCSLKTPQYCPPSQGGTVTNNIKPVISPVIKNNFDPSITNKLNLDLAAKAKADASAQAKALGVGYGGQGGLGGSGGNGYGGEGGQGNGFGGQTDITMSGIGNSYSNIPRQAPVAYAPPPMVSASAFSCTHILGQGASSTLGGISFSFPFTEDNCPYFVMSQFLYANGQPVQGCEILNNIREIKEVRQKTGFSCLPAVSRSAPASSTPMNAPAPSYWDKADAKTDAILNELHKRNVAK